ncbi:MAG: DUF2798 domain-containing protein [Devosiaceae bacterium]|nr:DUF2798 domain-containing protein [Devosiaceae bacterium MH13]
MPPKYAPVLFGFILSGLMSLLVSGIATWRAAGMPPEFISLWLSAWLNSWLVAFPAVLIVAPITRKLVGKLVKKEG